MNDDGKPLDVLIRGAGAAGLTIGMTAQVGKLQALAGYLAAVGL
ncbi:hypothetical protein [Xanthomonas tesorieronis]